MKPKGIILTLMLVIAVCCGVLSVAAEERVDPVLYQTKDGIKAVLEVSEPAGEQIELALCLTNEGAAYVNDVSVELTLPEGFAAEGDGSEIALPLQGETVRTVYSIAPIPKQTAADTTTPAADADGEKKGGCGAAVSAVVFCTALAGGLAVLLKDKRRGGALLVVLALCLSCGVFALSASAATTNRTIPLVAVVQYEGQKLVIELDVTYSYTFTETDIKENENSMEQFEITYYYGPQGSDIANEEYIKAIAECGFTSIPINDGGASTVEEVKQALELFRKYGLTCSGLRDWNILHAQNVGNSGGAQADVDTFVAEAVNVYKDYLDVIESWWIMDEPSADSFKGIAMTVDAIKRLDPERDVTINLFPTYAKSSQLGTDTYVEYLDRFITEVKPSYISYDHYHFLKNSTPRRGYFTNLEYVRDASLESGLDAMQIILLTKHMGYSDLTYEQILWEVNTSLAYGMKRISYFTFWLDQGLLNEGWSNACMDCTGKIYPHYYDVQKINKQTAVLGEELFGKTSTAVFHLSRTIEDECEEYTGYGDLGQVDGNNFVMGFFDDGSFMIVNKSYTESVSAVKQLELIDVTDGLQYFDTETAQWKDAEGGIASRNEAGRYVIPFHAGEGVLLRVVNN